MLAFALLPRTLLYAGRDLELPDVRRARVVRVHLLRTLWGPPCHGRLSVLLWDDVPGLQVLFSLWGQGRSN